MHMSGGSPRLSPTDLTHFLACAHRTQLDLQVAEGSRPAPGGPDASLELLFRKGLEHEQDYLKQLQAQYSDIVSIDSQDPSAAMLTEQALRRGAEVIYQATFDDGGARASADFLIRAGGALGAWQYDIVDTKLARRLKTSALLQMAQYATFLERITGQPPTALIVVAGDGEKHRYAYADVAAYARRAGAALQLAVAERPETQPEKKAYCGQCRWATTCNDELSKADDLSFVAGLARDQRQKLQAAGITTVAGLAGLTADALPRTIGRPTRERLVQQARLQVQERTTGTPAYELLEPVALQGLLRLPEPSPNDLYLDFEGDPYFGDHGLEYLAGLGDRSGGFAAYWAENADEEHTLIDALVGDLYARYIADPTMHVYHYAAYERTKLCDLTARYGVRERELDELLRGEVLVDLYTVVRQGVRISKGSYSIKKLEAFYWGETRPSGGDDDVSDAMSSVVEFERYLVERDRSILDAIEQYNRDDVRSTHDLHGWLEERRAELGEHARPAPNAEDADKVAARHDRELQEIETAEQLRAAGQPLLAALQSWHRRNARPDWWDYFRPHDLENEELISDTVLIGELTAPVLDGTVDRSNIWRYEFPPQECKFAVGDKVYDVDERKEAGEIVELRPEDGWVRIKRGKGRQPLEPRGFQHKKPLDTKDQRAALLRTAEQVLAGERPLAMQLIDRVPPTTLPVRRGETPADAVLRIGMSLQGEVLAVQGPPGAGKTTTGAELIRQLLDAGHTVGVVAQSHAVIGNLLGETRRPAVHQVKPKKATAHANVQADADRTTVLNALQTVRLAGGTSWLWAHEDARDSVDYLFIEEAGQYSLADAVAVSLAAKNLVLLGDPQQLAPPTRVQHPDGAGVTALGHLLDGAPTLSAEQGVFLDSTYRMHPDITRFVSAMSYDGRLESAPGRELQRVLGVVPWSGSGLRFVPVEHTGNSASSREEMQVVTEIVAALRGGTWCDVEGVVRPLTADHILVVAPYNAQVAMLREALPGVRVGTVDKFQGQQAPVVIYSLTSSTAADAPRGVDFLYDLNRLNVAVSRARCMAIVVGSPALADAAVRTPEQLRRVNALCSYVELAASASADDRRNGLLDAA